MVGSYSVTTNFFSNLREVDSLNSDRIQNTEPFSYVILDDFFPKPVADFLAQRLQNIPQTSWKPDVITNVKNYDFMDLDGMDELWRNFMFQSSHPQMLKFMESLTGISGLQPDPYYIASLQSFKNESFEEIHIDANVHGIHRLYRRISLVVYLNPDWRAEYGGQLEIWDEEMRECVHRIDSVYNRAVIYNFSNLHHGCPKIVACPPGVRQYFISLVYCTSQPGPADNLYNRGTLWQIRPEPGQTIPASLDLTELNKTQTLALLGQYETEAQQATQEYNSLVMQLSEALENQHILFGNGNNSLNDRLKANFRQAQLLEQKKSRVARKAFETAQIPYSKT